MHDLPANYDRHRAALQIVGAGACNPSGVALALHDACRQAIAQGVPQREDPAIRLIGHQLAFLLDLAPDLDWDAYGSMIEHCRARADEAARAAGGAPAP